MIIIRNAMIDINMQIPSSITCASNLYPCTEIQMQKESTDKKTKQNEPGKTKRRETRNRKKKEQGSQAPASRNNLFSIYYILNQTYKYLYICDSRKQTYLNGYWLTTRKYYFI